MERLRHKRGVVPELFFLMLLSGWLGGCATLPSAAGEGAKSPYAEVESLSAPEVLRPAELLMAEKKYQEAARWLDRFRPEGVREEIWQRYFLGQAQMELGSRELGLKTLERNYALLQKMAGDEALSSEEKRIAARSLKRIGQYYRQLKQYEKAYTYHQLQYLYLKRWGSAAELHDALLSLDVDSYELSNTFASEHWLLESLEVARYISDPLLRSRAQAMSTNNLADTLRMQRRWPEAIALIQQSREHWRNYESLQKGAEHRELWAILQTAEIYKDWAADLKAEPEEARAKGELAREQAEEALSLAANLKLDAAEQADLSARVRIFGLNAATPPKPRKRIPSAL